MAYLDGGSFTDGIAPVRVGSGYNSSLLFEQPDSFLFASNYSTVYPDDNDEKWGSYASQFNGVYYDIAFTSNSDTVQLFGIYSDVVEQVETQPFGAASADAGFQETGGSDFSGDTSVLLDWNGDPSATSDGVYSGYFFYSGPNQAEFVAQGGFYDSIDPGQTVDVRVWASGSSAALGMPGPSAGVGFALAALAQRRRRKRALDRMSRDSDDG